MKQIFSLFAALILIFLTVFSASAETKKSDNTGDIVGLRVLEERVKNNEEKRNEEVKRLEEKIKNSDEIRDSKIEALEKELELRSGDLKREMDLYISILPIIFAVLSIIFAVLSIIGYKNIMKWVQNIIRDKTEEEIRKKATEEYMEKILKEKGEEALKEFLDELDKKGRERLLRLDDLIKKYDENLASLKTRVIDLTKPISDETAKRLKDFTEALDMTKSEEEFTFDDWYYKGISEYEKKEYEEALKSFTKALEKKPDSKETYNNRGNAYYYLEEYDKAIEDYNKAIELDPKSALPYNGRGNAYYYLEEYDRAIEDYNKVIEIDPKYAVAYNNRGIVYSDLKQYERAIEDYNKAIELDPKYALAYLNLSEVLIIKNLYEDSLKIIEKGKLIVSETKDKALCIYLECIAKRLLDKSTVECENRLNEILKEDFIITWSFEVFESWLKDAQISEDKKRFITEKTELLKKHKR